jgi:hypothetical protein
MNEFVSNDADAHDFSRERKRKGTADQFSSKNQPFPFIHARRHGIFLYVFSSKGPMPLGFPILGQLFIVGWGGACLAND